MSDTYSYRPPLGLDIRIKPPKKEAERVRVENRVCEWPDCKAKGLHPAPKGKDKNGFQYLCLEHVREFNKSWNYFKDMSDTDVKSFIRNAATGHRPTWKMASGAPDGAASQPRFTGTRKYSDWQNIRDPHDIFAGGFNNAQHAKTVTPRSLTRPQKDALETLNLDESATMIDIKMRYKELAKRYHPDSNGGDTGYVERLKHVIRAYHVLKNAKFPEA